MGGAVFFGQKSGTRGILFKIYQVSNSILAAKSQKFVDTLGPQKPMWTKFLAFEFFLSEKKNLQLLPGKNLSWAHIMFILKSYNNIIDKIVNNPKTGQK